MSDGTPKNATRRQHTIPRMLLKRFASRSQGEEHYTWLFRRDGKPFETNIRNASVESHFYGKAINGVEDSLSVVESRHSTALDAILDGEDLCRYETSLRELVWTLAIRTGNFRRNMGDLLTGGIDEIIDQANPDAARRMLSDRLDVDFDKMLDEVVGKLPPIPARALKISLERRPALREKFRQVIGMQFDAEDVGGAFCAILSAVRAHLDVDKVTGNAHVRSLEKLAENDFVPESFRPAHWQLLRMPTRSMILGDGACFAIREDDDPGHLLRFTRDWNEIYLPVAHDAVLVASRLARVPRFVAEQINCASAALSYDQFFAAENGDRQRGLMSHIRSGTATLTPEEMRASAREMWLRKTASASGDEMPA